MQYFLVYHICLRGVEWVFQNSTHLKKKKAIFDLLFAFFSHQGKATKIPSAHI